MSKNSNATLLERELRATVRSGMFRSGEVSLSRAAEIAGMNSVRFRELWRQRGGRQEIELQAEDTDIQARRIARRRS